MSTPDEESKKEDIDVLREVLSRKSSPLYLEPWITMLSTFEGRDKATKFIQFGSRFMVWRQESNGMDSTVWQKMYSQTQEGRKSCRLLHSLTNLHGMLTELPKVSSTYEKLLVVGPHMGLACYWHFDYLAYLHRTGLIKFQQSEYDRITQIPGRAWTVCNVCQILRAFLLLDTTAKEISYLEQTLLASQKGDTLDKGKLEEELKNTRVKRFHAWLRLVKGVADLMCSTNMRGVQLRKNYPKTFGWMNEGLLGVCGMFSALAVCYAKYPAPSPHSKTTIPQPVNQKIAAGALAFVQLSSIWRSGVATQSMLIVPAVN